MNALDENGSEEEHLDTPLSSATLAIDDNWDIPNMMNEDTPTQQRNKRASTTKNNNNIEELKKSNLMDLAHKALTRDDTTEDKYQIFGKRIAYQFKELTEPQQTIAEKLISDVMFHAKLEKLTENSSVQNLTQPNNQPSYSVPQLIDAQPVICSKKLPRVTNIQTLNEEKRINLKEYLSNYKPY